MSTLLVKDIMVPIKEYATVSEDATLYEAVIALEKAQDEFCQTRYRHRAILVLDHGNKIVGKVSQLDLLKALEPEYSFVLDERKVSRAGYGLHYFNSLLKTSLWKKPLTEVAKSAARQKVKEFMYKPAPGEHVRDDATLEEGVHQLIVGKHQSLLVTKGDEIAGVLRLTDVFMLVCEEIKTQVRGSSR